MTWFRKSTDEYPIYWRGSGMRQSWLAYWILRIALMIDGVEPATPQVVHRKDSAWTHEKPLWIGESAQTKAGAK